MPPKAKAAKRVKQDAERVSHPVVEAPLPGTKELTGFLSMLPLEILMEVLVRCEPSGVTRLLATSKALTNIANENETTIYRKLYHNLLVKDAVGAHVIHSPVWKKGKASISYPLSAPLPAAAVYSWKLQYKTTAMYRPPSTDVVANRIAGICCVRCGISQRTSAILNVASLQLNICLLCYAKELLPQSPTNAVATMRLTKADVASVAPVELPTDGETTKKFFSAGALEQLAIQRHGQFDGPVGVDDIESAKRQRREAIVAVATLLQGGVGHFLPLPRQEDFDAGHSGEELDCFIRNGRFVKPKNPSPPHPKGFVNLDQLTKRPIEEILRDYVKLIRNHKDDFPLRPRSSDGVEHPFFLPASRPGPIMPTEKSIAAFDKLVGKERLDEYRKLLRLEWSPLTIRTLRRYIQHPTDVNFQAANDLLDDRRLHHPESPYQKQTRQRFDPLLADQPYDFSPYLSALRSGATRRRSTEGERRIELIVQFGAIVSYPIRLEVLGLAAGDPPPRHNQFLEFISSGLGLLPEIYYETRQEQIREFHDLGFRTAGPYSNAHLAQRLVPACSFPPQHNLLSNRTELSFAQIEEELVAVAHDVRSRIISFDGFLAALHEADTFAECPRIHGTGNICLNDCWIGEAAQNELEESLKDLDWDEGEYM